MLEAIKKFFQIEKKPTRDSMIFFQEEEPTGREYQMGDLWYQLDESNRVVKQHVWAKEKKWRDTP